MYVLKIEPSYLQGSEPYPNDQLDEMCKLKLKTFVYCSLSRTCSLTTELNTEECTNTYSLPAEEFYFITVSVSIKYSSCSVGAHNLNVSRAGYYVLSAVKTLPKVWSVFPLRYMWVLFVPKLDIHSLVKCCIIV